MTKTIVLAGGCFWGLEAYLRNLNGVLDTTCAYANSNIENPSYEDVCSSKSSAAEAVIVSYDNSMISLSNLLKAFYEVIDVTSLNKQGGDIGSQYRTGVYYKESEDLATIRKSLHNLQSTVSEKVQIELKPLENIYEAEEYHQDYLNKNPNGYCHIPKRTIEDAKTKAFPSD